MNTNTNVVIVPMVHMNGTSEKALYEEYERFLASLSEARDVPPEVNARDYYPQGEGAYDRAAEQKRRWLRQLDQIKAEVTAVLMGINGEANKDERGHLVMEVEL